MKTSPTKQGRVFSSVTRALIAGAGSILNISGADAIPFSHSHMARQDRDARSMRSDWKQVGGNIRSAIDRECRNPLRKKY